MRVLSGRTAIVTGASSGIGTYIARALAVYGMDIVLAARNESQLEAVSEEIGSLGTRALVVPTDVANADDRKNLVDRTLAKFGQIDVLINNAGIETYCPTPELPIEKIVQTIDVNLTASLVLARLVIPHMQQRGAGHIVNVSSTAGKHGPAYGIAYGASKAGLVSMAESLRAEFHKTGISASVVCPGFTHAGGIFERMKQATGKGTPPQIGATSAEKVAAAVVKAIRKDQPEVIVNWPPMRPVFALAEMWPRVGQSLIRLCSQRFLKRIATKRLPEEQTHRKAA